jgi:4-hydroxy-3-methylbut-2-enyl diphosphate reductase
MEVVRGLEAEGAVFVEELDEVPRGSIVIFSAHGVAPAIAADARLRGLISYDAVCPLVAKVHREVERHQRGGRQLVLIGHEGHPEIEGTLGHVAGVNACVVKSVGDVARLPFDAAEPTAYAIQTTYSVEDAHEIVEALREKFADLAGPATSDICYATTNRQAAAREIALQSDAVVVVGERFSSNASRLAEVASSICERVQLVAEPGEIDWTRMPNEGAVGITAAASTPERAVQAVLHAFRDRYRVTIEELESIREATVFKPLALT